MQVRPFGPDDASFAAELAELEGWSTFTLDLERLVRLEPEGCLIGERDGRPIGLATTISYGKLGWIGSLIIQRPWRGQGYGRALLDRAVAYLIDRGARTIGLEAPLPLVQFYEAAGFVPAFETFHLRRPALPAPSPLADSLVAMDARDLHAVTMFDWALFGGRRRRALRDLFRCSPVAYLSQDQKGLAGYLLARQHGEHWLIGPWVCVRSSEPLLTAGLAAIGAQPVQIGVPGPNEQALNLLRRYGFEVQGRRVRLYQGDPEGMGQPQHIWAIACPTKG